MKKSDGPIIPRHRQIGAALVDSSAEHRREIRRRAPDVLRGIECNLINSQFIINDSTALKMTESLATKNPGLMRDTLGDSLSKACVQTMDSPIDTYSEEWEEVLSEKLGANFDLARVLENGSTEDVAKLRQALQDSRFDGLDLPDDSYIRLLHAIALTTIPKDGFKDRHATNYRERHKDTRQGLFSMSVNILNNFAAQEPGLSVMRDRIMGQLIDDDPVSDYLARLYKSELARYALRDVIALPDGYSINLAREITLKELQSAKEDEVGTEDIDIEIEAHLLTWEILPHDFEDIEGTIDKLKKKTKKQAKTPEARDKIEQHWDNSRLYVLLNIAKQENKKGRPVKVMISNVFAANQEFYVAAVFEHTNNPVKKIVIADNPMTENAIYLVDEEHTKENSEGMKYGWEEVLGANKKIARRRGARRRQHLGEWEDTVDRFCVHGIGALARRRVREEVDIIDTVNHTSHTPVSTVGKHDITVTRLEIDRLTKLIDKIYKELVD